MKYLTIAAAALLGLTVSQKASAQCAYDAITGVAAVNYYTGAGFNLAGDVIRSASPSVTTFNTLSVLYVCTVAGTYTISVEGRNSYTFPNLINDPARPLIMSATGTFNIPAPGVYRLNFQGPCVNVGPTDQTFTFTSVPNFYVAAANIAAAPAGSDPFGGLSYDAGVVNGLLRPAAVLAGGDGEWYNLNGAHNIAFSLCGGPCVVVAPPVGGDAFGQSYATSVEKIDELPASLGKLDVRIDPTL